MNAQRLIDRLIVVWGSPESINDPAYIAEIERAVGRADPGVLEQAADFLIDNYRGARFPTPAQIVNAVREVTPPLNAHPEGPKHPEWEKPAIDRADRLINCEMGRKAAREGWILGLHDFCRNNGKLPNQSEIHLIIRESKQFDEAYSACCEGRGGKLGDALKRLGDTFIEKRNRYAAMAMGERA